MSGGNLTSGTASAGVFAAFTASLCCITPVLALISGVSGMAATFSWIEPFRPYMIGLTTAVLSFAWYLQLRPKSREIDCECEDDNQKKPFIQTKKFLGIVTVVAAILLSFPSYSHLFYPNIEKQGIFGPSSEIKLVTFDVKGMTCKGCEEHVIHATMKLDGVFKADASWEEMSASITFDQVKAPVDSLVKAINNTGYEVINIKSIREIDLSEIIPDEELNN